MTDPTSLTAEELLAQLDLLPPHDPDRYETTDDLGDPDYGNGTRASSVVEALEVFRKAQRMDENDEDVIPDLITNLLHLAHSRGVSPKDVLRSGLMHFVAEAGGASAS